MAYVPGLNISVNSGSPTTATAFIAADYTTFTLAQIAAVIGSAPAETISVTTPTTPAASTTFTLAGTYTNGPPTALDYSFDGGTTWTAATSPTIGSGAFSISVAGGLAAGTYPAAKVRDHNATSVIGTAGAGFTIAAGGAAYTITYSASGHPDIGIHFPSTAGNPGAGGVTIYDGRFYVYDSSGNPPSTFDLTWTRSGSVTPTSGTGPNQYNTGNNRDLQTFTSSDLYSNQGTYPALFDSSIAHSAIWNKPVSSDGGSGTYYGWFRVAGVWYQPAGFTVAVS